MANNHLQRKPHDVTEDLWWYEEPGGICICFKNGNRFNQALIPWRSVRAAIKRKDKK